MTVYLGCDPGSDYMGLARLDGDSLTMSRIRMGGGALTSANVNDVRWHMGDDRMVVGIEQPPPTVRKDVNHGHQAPIGWRLGLAASTVIVPALRRGWPVTEVPVGEWRATMLVHAARGGLLIQKPSRRGRVGRPMLTPTGSTVARAQRLGESGGFEVHFKWCAHVHVADNYEDMIEIVNCPECAKPPKPVTYDEIRDAWKRICCEWVAHFWPDEYVRIVAQAKKTARTEKPDHQLVGVADACEAVGVAVHMQMTHEKVGN